MLPLYIIRLHKIIMLYCCRKRPDRSRSRSRDVGPTRGSRKRKSRSRSVTRKKSRSDSRSPVRHRPPSPDIKQYGKITRTTIAYATSLAAELSKRRKLIEMKQAKEKEKAAITAKDAAPQSEAKDDNKPLVTDAPNMKRGILEQNAEFGEAVRQIALPPTPPLPAAALKADPAVIPSIAQTIVAPAPPTSDAPDGMVMEPKVEVPAVPLAANRLLTDLVVAKAPPLRHSPVPVPTPEKATQVARDTVDRLPVKSTTPPPVTRLTSLPMPPMISEDDYDSVNEDQCANR